MFGFKFEPGDLEADLPASLSSYVKTTSCVTSFYSDLLSADEECSSISKASH